MLLERTRDAVKVRAPDAAPWLDWSRLAGLGLLLLVGTLTLVPVAVVVLGSFKAGRPTDPFVFTLDGWAMAVQNPKTLAAMGNTLLLALRVPAALVVGLAVAWLLVRARIPGHELIEFCFWVAFFLPSLPVTLGWVLLLDPNYGLLNEALKRLPFVTGPVFNVYSMPGIFWVQLTASSIPIMAVLMAPVFRQFDGSFEESSRVCGASPLLAARSITLPLIAPAILTALLAGLIRAMETFEVERVLGVPARIEVYSTRLYDLIRTEPPVWPGAMALSTIFLILLLVLAVLYLRYTASRSFVTITGRGTSFRPLDIGRWRYVGTGICLLLLVFSLFIPLATLTAGSFMRLYGMFTIEAPFTLNHWQRVLTDPLFGNALGNSVMLGLSVAVVGLVCYSALAYVIVRTNLPGRNLLGILAWLPWGVPGILLGVGILTLVFASPLTILYGTIGALVLALCIKEMPFATHMLKSSFGQLSIELEQASRVCGAGWLRTYWSVVLPLVSPTVVTLFVLLFLGSIRDIGTVVLLSNPQTRPLSVLLLEFSVSGNLEGATVVGMILTLLAIVVAAVTRRMGLRIGTANT